MNKPASTTSFVPSPRIDLHSSGLEQLFAEIAEGESEREKERILPFNVIDRIRQAKLGALRLPASAGGSGCSIRELFAIIIRLGEADANVAHILRNHFSVVELLLRRPRNDQDRQSQAAVADGGVGSISEGMQRLANQGLASAFDVGDRFWIDIDDAAAFGRAEREAGQLMAAQ